MQGEHEKTCSCCEPLHSPGHGDGEVLGGVEHVDQTGPAGGADGPQGVAAALQLGHRHVLMAVRLQELQGTLGKKTHTGYC